MPLTNKTPAQLAEQFRAYAATQFGYFGADRVRADYESAAAYLELLAEIQSHTATTEMEPR